MTLEKRIKDQLAEIEAKGLTRKMASPQGIDLSSNNYLCLAKDERLKVAMLEAVKRDGVGSTASRLLRGHRNCFAEIEKQFARWKGAERSLYFNSGYQANIGVLPAFLRAGDVVFSDELNHASLIDGMRLAKSRKVIFPHLDAEKLEKLLRETDCEGEKFLVTESLFSMDGDLAPLSEYARICAETGTNLIVDEAHAVGIYGEKGSGLIEQSGIADQVFLSINTAGKALGVGGAFIAGPEWAIDYLINRCRSFIYSTAPVPAVADALEVAIEIVEKEKTLRDNLLYLSRFLRFLLNENGIAVPVDNSQIIPVIIGDSEKTVSLAADLQSAGFDVRAIRPPTVPEGAARLRLSVNTCLDENILRNFVDTLKLLIDPV
ncbi:MAG: 8-amino-7-oxononanoate synthase [Pyrinomonadaceae bacterium]